MKVTKYDNYRVEVEIEEPWMNPTHESRLAIAERVKNSIRRHVDEIKNVVALFDRTDICEFCGSEWKGALDTDGTPICCEKARDEWEANRINGEQADSSELKQERNKEAPANGGEGRM